jgi:hypothetical protein
MKNVKTTILSAAFAGSMLLAGTAQAALVDITTLPGFEVVTTSTLNFNSAGGLAGWSVPNGKVILGAKIISSGDTVSDFAVFRPTGPGETWNGYTLGANEYGFAFQAKNGTANSGVQFELYYADPLANYTITKSADLNYSDTGWGGWSAPAGQVVSGGGYQFFTSLASPASSQIADSGSVWPHYTFGTNEQGWVVQNGGTASTANVYVISFDAPLPPVPLPAAAWLLGSGLLGLFGLARRKTAVATA